MTLKEHYGLSPADEGNAAGRLEGQIEAEVELKNKARLEDFEEHMRGVFASLEEAQGELSTEHTHLQTRVAVMIENAETIFKLIERAKD